MKINYRRGKTSNDEGVIASKLFDNREGAVRIRIIICEHDEIGIKAVVENKLRALAIKPDLSPVHSGTQDFSDPSEPKYKLSILIREAWAALVKLPFALS